MPKLFYAAVNNGFIVSASEETSQILRRIMVGDLRLHYTIRLSNEGREPATHYGCNGVIEDREAEALIQYYDGVQRNSIDAWCLSADGSLLLWTKKDGMLDPPQQGRSFEDFLGDQPPGLRVITQDENERTVNLMVKVPRGQQGRIQAIVREVINGSNADWLKQPLSPDGNNPPTIFAGLFKIPLSKEDEIREIFPVDPDAINHVYLFRDETLYWTNLKGYIDPGPNQTIAHVTRAENLKPIRNRRK